MLALAFRIFYVSFLSIFLVVLGCVGGGVDPQKTTPTFNTTSSTSPPNNSALAQPFGTLHAYPEVSCLSISHLPHLAVGSVSVAILFAVALLVTVARRTADPSSLAQGLFASQDSLYGIRLLLCEARQRSAVRRAESCTVDAHSRAFGSSGLVLCRLLLTRKASPANRRSSRSSPPSYLATESSSVRARTLHVPVSVPLGNPTLMR